MLLPLFRIQEFDAKMYSIFF